MDYVVALFADGMDGRVGAATDDDAMDDGRRR